MKQLNRPPQSVMSITAFSAPASWLFARLQHDISLHPDVCQLLRYAAAGLVGTAAHFAVLLGLVTSMGPVLASTVGAIAGCVLNYVLVRQLVFASIESTIVTFPKFVTVATCTVVLNAALMWILVPGLPVLAAQVVATGAAFAFGFAMNRGWTFCES